MDEPRGIHPGYLLRDLRRERLAVVVLVVAAVVLTLVEYLFLAGSFTELFPGVTREYAPGIWHGGWANVPDGTRAPWWGVLVPYVWWVAGMGVLWVALPCAATRPFGFGARDLGLRVKGLAGKLWVYGLLYMIVLVGVVWAGTQEGFTRTYPMLRPQTAPSWCWVLLLCWWGLYAVQFFAVEFFFRGWMLFTLEKRFGMAAIAIMIVPYCMIHYHKPLPEALGAIVAGLVLGWLALRTRSIWGGWLLHVAVAITMDVLSLMKGDWGLPTRFMP